MSAKYGIFFLSPAGQNDVEKSLAWSLDIVAIHGLNGDKFKTWAEPKSQTLWLRDLLPNDLPRARVMTFGYNATAMFENSKAGIRDHARNLLVALVEARDGGSAPRRPLILIGHSLGGLVLKQALLFAQHESRYKQIHDSIRGVVFFGTPHQGSGLANYATILVRISNAVIIKPRPQLLDALRKESRDLKRLTEAFKAYIATKSLDIVSFYELKTIVGVLVVEKSSALLTPLNEDVTYEEQIPVNANHRGMCQFASDDDETYRATVRSIKRLYQSGGIPNMKCEHCNIPHTANPHFTGRNEIREQLGDCLIYSRQGESQQRFVLHGIGGSGKTQICLKFAQDYCNKFWGIFWIDASSIETIQQGFLDIARTCKSEENVDKFKTWLSSKKHWLLIFDNADDPAVDISKFFPTCAESTILITTRNPGNQHFANAGSYKVDEMSPEDSVCLLQRTSASGEWDQSARSMAEQIVKDLGYLALAIVQAGAVIRQRICSLDGFRELYSTRKKELIESGRSNSSFEYQYSVFTTWEISVLKIEENSETHAKLALELLRLFAFMHFDNIDGGIFQLAREHAEANKKIEAFTDGILDSSLLVRTMPSGWDGVLWGKALGLLAAFSLITVGNAQRVFMHPLLHEWSRDRMSDTERRMVWKTAAVTVASSTTQLRNYADLQQRKKLLPHIETIMAHEDGQMFAPGPELQERSFAAAKFMVAYTESRRLEKALNMGLQDLKSKDGILSPEDHYCHTIRLHVASNMHLMGRWSEAVAIQQSLIADLRKSDPPEFLFDDQTSVLIHAMLGLGCTYLSMLEFQKAIDICNEAITTCGQTFDSESPIRVGLQEVIALSSLGLGKGRDVLANFEAVLEARKKTLGDAHLDTFLAMLHIAQAYEELKMYKKSWDMLEGCVPSMKESLGSDHPLTKWTLSKLAYFPVALRRPRAWRKLGLVYREEVLEMMIDDFGPDAPKTLLYMAQLAMEFFLCGMPKKALDVQERVVELLSKAIGEEHLDIGREREDLEMMRKAVKLRKVVCWMLPRKGLGSTK